jgi:cell division protein FtsB
MVVRRISAWQKRILAGLLACGAIGYFAWHAFHGNYGIYAREAVELRVAELRQELAEVTAERRASEHRVSLLKAQSLDPDILEERARETLGLAHPNDVVVLERPAPQPAAQVVTPRSR